MNKKTKQIIASMIIATSMGILMTGCSISNPMKSAPKSESVTWVETLDGKKVDMKVSAPPKKAVSMSFATTEMMLALGLQDQMAGTAFKEDDIYPPLADAYAKVPVLAEKWPSYEKLMSVKPDFVTGWEVPFTKRGIPAEKIIAAGIPIFVPDSMQDTKATLDTNFNDMLEYGKIFGKEDNAKKWVDAQKKKLEAVQKKLKDLPHVKAFVFDSEDGDPFTVFEGYTTNILKLIGVDNVMAGQGVDKTWSKTSWESFVKANPDYIIIVDYSTSDRNDGDFEKKVESLKSNPQISEVTAIKEGHFIRVKLSEITPGVRTVDALERLAKEMHPDMK